MSQFKQSFIRYLKRAGAGSMLISIVIHIVILGAATVWIVSEVQPAREAKFQGGGAPAGPEISHPVRMSNTQPNLESLSQRLSVDTATADIALPDLPSLGGFAGGGMSGTGGLGGGVGAGLGEGSGVGQLRAPIMPAFGFREAQPSGTLVGRFYDFKQTRNRRPNPDLARSNPGRLAQDELTKFYRRNWSLAAFNNFYQAPTSLYATQIFIPQIRADEAPKAFGVEKEVEPRAWAVHYRGRVSPPETGVYRFVGVADDFMAVRVDGRVVLDGGVPNLSNFQTDLPNAPVYQYDFSRSRWINDGRGGVVIGNRMQLRAGQFYDIDIIISEGPGGDFFAQLLFQQEGVTYEKDRRGNPILPIFRVAPSEVEATNRAIPFKPDGPIWRAAVVN